MKIMVQDNYQLSIEKNPVLLRSILSMSDMGIFFQRLKNSFLLTTLYNLLLMMVLFMLCRIAFYLFNTTYFNGMTVAHFTTLCTGGIQFDLTAVLYTNTLYCLTMLTPLPFRVNNGFQTVAKWLFIVSNSVVIVANCMDMVYYRFTLRRTTMAVIDEFSNDGNIGQIIGVSIFQYWYVTLFAVAMLFLLVKLYYQPRCIRHTGNIGWYLLRHTVVLLVFVFCFVTGVRGGVGSFVRPITLSNANKYVKQANEAYIVLNTPFCVYRTIGLKTFVNPHYFPTRDALDEAFTPVIQPQPSGEFKNMNVVIFILESFSKEYIGELNRDLDGGDYKGYTPFLDSLIRQGLTFEYTFANGFRSIDAMPSVLSSIPAFYEPYILTPYSTNKVSGIAGELDRKGYYTAFFHGAPNGSMGFQSFANVSGYQDYFGLTEYGNNDDYDGTWAIWDEEFFQFFAETMNEFRQPFCTALFSASSHHPFRVPKKYADRFKDESSLPLHKCIRYSDFALRRFFETASRMSWFSNTLFVITADHTNELTRPEYQNAAGRSKVPIVFFHPGGELQGRIPAIAQQIDIMPTVLSYLNYDRPYVAFGHNLLDSATVCHAMMYPTPVFQYFEGKYMYQFDEEKFTAIYDFVNDIPLQNNLINEMQVPADVEKKVKSRIQQYIERMIENRLTVGE
ncbi:MAG: LTA synthase family protein [Bacteroidales bacterium]|jgi:phosphoglycerol transferase MdoB-like AlkP superfamily enzyme|nr:LTA synthase family protein [Bacteroidales bacterium]